MLRPTLVEEMRRIQDGSRTVSTVKGSKPT